jgi:hypothetical protein
MCQAARQPEQYGRMAAIRQCSGVCGTDGVLFALSFHDDFNGIPPAPFAEHGGTAPDGPVTNR